MPRHTPIAINSELLILAEGSADEAMFSHLCGARNITGFQVIGLKGTEKGTPTGNSGFLEYLSAMVDVSGFDLLRGVVVVVDGDEGPDQRFSEVRKQLKKAGYGEPNNPLEVASSRPGFPAVAIAVIPFDANGPRRGCLETMIINAATGCLSNNMKHVESFCDAVVTASWKPTNVDKLKLRCLLSSCCPDEPERSLARSIDPAKGMVDLAHVAFDGLSKFLEDFKETVCQ